MTRTTWRSLDARLREKMVPDLSREAVADLVYAELARVVPYDFACLATTDPVSGVVTWASKTRSLGVGDEEFAAVEYGPPDINKFEDLARRRPPVGALCLDTGGRPDTCRRHREYMAPRFGFTDELRAVFLRRGASWGALGIYRRAGDPPFTSSDVEQVAGIGETVAEALQRALFRTPSAGSPHASHQDGDGPAVLVVDHADRPTHLTPAARAVIDELGGLDHGSLPANMLAVVATTRTTRQHLTSPVLTTTGRWVSLRAALLEGAEGADDVVVSVEPTPPARLSRMTLAAHGLTAREEEVALQVLQGVDTQGIAAALHLSPHTVQDHLKAIFAKVGVNSRRALMARFAAS